LASILYEIVGSNQNKLKFDSPCRIDLLANRLIPALLTVSSFAINNSNYTAL